MTSGVIRIRGARQHNLKNLDLDLHTGEMTVFTGPSGSGKSSLVFDTLYAEGQRRYVETFSAYARQFLDRMDRPAVERIDGVPPAIAIDQTNPVRTSRSTVGTMTELNDHLKLLFARAGALFDRRTARPVRHDTTETIFDDLAQRAGVAGDPRLVFTFPVELPADTSAEQQAQWLAASGFTRVHGERVVERPREPEAAAPKKGKAAGKAGGGATATTTVKVLDIVADRLRLGRAERVRVMEAIELALRRGGGRLDVHVLRDERVEVPGERAPGSMSAPPSAHASNPAANAAGDGSGASAALAPTHGSTASEVAPAAADAAGREVPSPEVWRYSTGLHCPDSDLRYADPQPSLFSFNSAVGACDTCRGFGRVIGVDWGLVIPDERKTLRSGAIKPLQTPAWAECQDDLLKYAGREGIPRDTPWSQLGAAQREWVLEGSPHWNGNWNQQWYGIRRFFGYLESKAYKMHIRVLLSKYRSYTPCQACGGARLKTEALLWRLGTREAADAVLPPAQRFLPVGVDWSRAQLEALPGLGLHDLMQLPIERLRRFFDTAFEAPRAAAPPPCVAGLSDDDDAGAEAILQVVARRQRAARA